MSMRFAFNSTTRAGIVQAWPRERSIQSGETRGHLKGVYRMSLWNPVSRASFTQPPAQPPAQPFSLPLPIVYERVTDRARWEYRVVSVDLREEPPLDEERLGALGAEGWLLAGAIQPPVARDVSHTIIYYFVRQA
jgi:hypothetical protein